MKLSVLIPCYNEQQTILELVQAVRQAPVADKEIIIVDDSSTDGTTAILQEQIEPVVDKVVYHGENRGKGAAIRSALHHATGEIVIIQDADLEYDPQDYALMIQPILEGKADVVFGSRFLTGKYRRVLFFWHMVGNRVLTLLSNMLTNLNLTDMETGYKAFRREIIQDLDLVENRFGFEPEITAKIAKKKLRIYEVGISYAGRTYADGKKINWRDGLWALYCIIKYNFLS